MEAGSLDVPITLEHHTFVDYAFKHWLDSLKNGVPSRTLCLLGPPGIGKCLGQGTLVLMADGRTLPVEQIMIGDRVMGPDGEPRNVLSVTTGRSPLYRIDPIKGEPWICNDKHVLTLVRTDTDEIVDVEIENYLHVKSKWFRERHKQFSVGVESFEGVVEPCKVDPYFLGVWFGDGGKSTRVLADGSEVICGVRISKPDREIRDVCHEMAARWELRVRSDSEDSSSVSHNIVADLGQDNRLLRALRDTVGPDLRVPIAILRGTTDVRRQFLAGFIDTDGELASNCYVIAQKREDWARAVWRIARSLGLCATITKRKARNQTGFEGEYHVVTISGDVDQIPCRIPRRQANPRKQRKVATRTGFVITPIGTGAYYGFSLDGDKRFLLGDFTVTHNSSAAHDIADRMTDYVRANPQIIFGVETVKEALQLLTSLREEELGKEESDKLPTLVVEDILAVAELLDFSSKLPEDLGGLPFRAGDGFVDYCPQRWVGRLSAKFAFGVYVEDDLAAAAQAMQTAGRQSALERRIHEHKFAPGILVMVTGNRREDRSAASTLPAHFRNSVCLLAIEPSVEEWKKWYGKQPGCDPIIAAYLTWRPEDLSQLPSDQDKMGAFATPRQWFSLGQQFKTAKSCGDSVLLAISAGLIGKPRALDFNAFVEIRSTLVDPEKVFENPEKMLPDPCAILDEPSKCIAMVCALGEIGAHRWKRGKGAVKTKAPEKLIRSLAWVCAAGDEYSAVGVQTFLDNGGNLTSLARVARDCRGDPVIGRLLDHIKSALLG